MWLNVSERWQQCNRFRCTITERHRCHQQRFTGEMGANSASCEHTVTWSRKKSGHSPEDDGQHQTSCSCRDTWPLTPFIWNLTQQKWSVNFWSTNTCLPLTNETEPLQTTSGGSEKVTSVWVLIKSRLAKNYCVVLQTLACIFGLVTSKQANKWYNYLPLCKHI